MSQEMLPDERTSSRERKEDPVKSTPKLVRVGATVREKQLEHGEEKGGCKKNDGELRWMYTWKKKMAQRKSVAGAANRSSERMEAEFEQLAK